MELNTHLQSKRTWPGNLLAVCLVTIPVLAYFFGPIIGFVLVAVVALLSLVPNRYDYDLPVSGVRATVDSWNILSMVFGAILTLTFSVAAAFHGAWFVRPLAILAAVLLSVLSSLFLLSLVGSMFPIIHFKKVRVYRDSALSHYFRASGTFLGSHLEFREDDAANVTMVMSEEFKYRCMTLDLDETSQPEAGFFHQSDFSLSGNVPDVTDIYLEPKCESDRRRREQQATEDSEITENTGVESSS